MLNLRDTLAHDLLNCSYETLNERQKSVIDLIADQRPSNIGPELKDESSYWDRVADMVARALAAHGISSWASWPVWCCG
jgi:hypothetical protein